MLSKLKCFLVAGIVWISVPAPVQAQAPQNQVAIALGALRSAVSPVGGAPGSVMASPSRANPNYFYHWVRDASITMNVMIDRYDQELATGNQSEAAETLVQLRDFALFSKQSQATDNRSGAAWDRGVGEPKFEMTGAPFMGDWGRPQNDGPALRAIAMMRFVQRLETIGKKDFITEVLYSKQMPARTLIKADLEYVAHHWREPSFDLWEEVMGNHFFTRVVQYSAMAQGANFANHMQDPGAAAFYQQQANQIAATLPQFWDAQRGYIVETRDGVRGLSYKSSGLDSGVVIGVLLANIPMGPFSIDDPRVAATVAKMEQVFHDLYPVNSSITKTSAGQPLAPAIGRYPEDRYTGTSSDGQGNPWFIATQAFAEYYYRVANKKQRQGAPAAQVQSLRERGDAYMRRAMWHTDTRGHQSEQINRQSGYMQGAIDLTWNYASFLSAVKSR